MPLPALEAAQAFLDQGDVAKALGAFAEAAAARPDSAAVLGGWGTALAASGHFREAVPLLRQAARQEPRAAEWLNILGVALCHAGDLEAAEAAFQQASLGGVGAVAGLLNRVDLYRFQGRYSEALDCLRQALDLAPGDAEVLVSFGLLSVDLDEPEGVRAALAQLRSAPLLGAALPSPDGTAVTLLRRVWAEALGRLPIRARAQRLATELRRQATTPRIWGADEIALFCRQHLGKWSPRTLARGIGGSEEAVIHLSRELARLGWRVTVYGNPVDEAGEYDGVTYQSCYFLNPADCFNIFISWRGVGIFSSQFAAKGAYLWLHDVPRADRFTSARLSHITKLFVLSGFHRGLLPAVPDEMFLVTGNGIDVAEAEALEREGLPRDPHRCIYASAYDRGLETLLTIWSEVRQAVPQAELHIFYGWQTFDSLAEATPENRRWKARMERLMEQPGVLHHGRVGQSEVLRETFRSGIWAYPAHFPEISCITAMKCQAAGAVPVTSDYAALHETVQFGIKVAGTGNEVFPPDKQDEYKQALIRALLDVGWQERVRQEMMPWARQKFAWQNVAWQWDKEFRRAITEAA